VTDDGSRWVEACRLRADGSFDASEIRRRVLRDHEETLASVLVAADVVAADWETDRTTRRSAVSEPLESELRRRNLEGPLLEVLATAVTAVDRELPAEPVPAPPYLTVNGRGPLLRATVDGGRVLVAIAAFTVERDPVRYVRSGDRPADVLEVAVKR